MVLHDVLEIAFGVLGLALSQHVVANDGQDGRAEFLGLVVGGDLLEIEVRLDGIAEEGG